MAKKFLSKINKNNDDIYIKDLEASKKVAIVSCTTSALPQTLSIDTLYNITNAVTTMTLNLPSVSNSTYASGMEVFFTTGSGTPSVTITPASGDTVAYFSGYQISASKSYELNIMWNGAKWVVAYAVIE